LPDAPETARSRNAVRKPRVRVDTWYAHPPEKVWKTMTDGRKLSRWLLPTTDNIEPRVGHRFGFTAPDGGHIACEVTDAEPGRRLAFTWQTEEDAPPSEVTWTLTPADGGTRLVVEQDGAPGGLSPLSGGTLRLTACLADHVGSGGMSAPSVGRSVRRPPLGLVMLSTRTGHRRIAVHAVPRIYSREVTSCR
jgi:uncharacterized protein YndB with AHSA1/START domain